MLQCEGTRALSGRRQKYVNKLAVTRVRTGGPVVPPASVETRSNLTKRTYVIWASKFSVNYNAPMNFIPYHLNLVLSSCKAMMMIIGANS